MNPSDSAFPRPVGYGENPLKHNVNGLSKREYFAAKAMQAIITTSPNLPEESRLKTPELFALASLELADALIKSMEETK